MTHDDPPVEPPPTLREEAAAWFAKMRGDDAAEHRTAFEAWLARGALHRAAYNRIGEVFAAGKLLKPGEKSDEREASAATSHRSRSAIVAGLSVSALVVGAVWFRPSMKAELEHPPGDAAQRAEPDRFEIRSLVLADGERVILDVDGALAPDIAGRPRRVRLDRGRARFAVRAPRAVLAGRTEVRTDGGTFDLWLHPDGSLDAQVLSGNVHIRPAIAVRSGNATDRAILVAAGRRYTIDRFGRGTSSRATASEWPSGVLEYRAAPLADVVNEANRYSAIKIVLADPKLGERKISGRFVVDGALRLARRLALALSLEIDRTRPGSIILRQRQDI